MMRHVSQSLGLVLLLCACAGPGEVERHWGEAQRGATEAMADAARDRAGRGIDGAGATSAHENYVESLEPLPDERPGLLLDVVESD
jgi:hypothetical protein